MKARSLTALLTISFVLALSGFRSQANAQEPRAVDATTKTEAPNSRGSAGTNPTTFTDERYQIGSGDVLEVLVYNHPQLSRPAVRVDARGMIRIPLIEGEIKAACKSESDLSIELTNRYREYQKYPQVDVYVKEFNSQPVAVLGAVRTPGRFQLQRRVRLLEILTFSGGATLGAGRTVQIVRGGSGPQLCVADAEAVEPGEEVSSYPLNDTLHGVDAANPYLTPGDLIFVPEAEQVYVVGNVAKPAAIPLTEQITLTQAIFMAGGLLSDSDQSKVRVVRRATGSITKTEMLVDLKTINKGTMKDIVLQPNDVIEVSKQGGAKAVLKGIMATIVPTAMSLPTRIVY